MNETIENSNGYIAFERVAFDSDIFGVEVGRVTDCRAAHADGFAALHAAVVARGRFAHLTRRIAGDAHAERAALERSGYALVDLGIVFDHDLAGVAPEPAARFASADDIERIVTECGSIFRTSRYYHDPLFDPAGGDELHRRWIRNAHGGLADAVLVNDDASAFVTCAVDASRTGNIALFGVSARTQGRGEGARLLRAALGWFAARSDRVTVKTQAINRAASRMYERAGFRLDRSELTYARVERS